MNIQYKRTCYFLLGLLGLLIIMAIFAPFITPFDPYKVNLTHKLFPIFSSSALENGYYLGTDHLGRDILSRLIYGTRVSLVTVIIIVSAIICISLLVGTIAGYKGGIFDAILMRFSDFFLTFPTFILGLFFIGVLGVGIINVILTIIITHWAWYARMVRSMVLQIKNQDYILASKSLGSNDFQIISRHIIPSVFSQISILASLDFGHMLLHVAGLSFLGLGIQAPTAEWGVMINDALPYIYSNPALMILPGFCIFIVVAIFNSLGELLRDYVQFIDNPNYEQSNFSEK